MQRLPALILKAIVVPVVALLCLETALRLFDYGYSSQFTVPCKVEGNSAFCNNDRYTRQYFAPGAFRLPPAFAIPAEKGPATFRIFVVGESAAEGDPEPAYGFARYLEVMLRERFPAAHFEIINTSITAVNSHVLLPAVRDLTNHNGDLFLLYMGNNEIVGPFGPENPLSANGAGLAVIRLGIFLRSTRLWQLVDSAISWVSKEDTPSEWRGMETFLDHQVPADATSLVSVYANFRRNLRDIITVAREAGARVLVSTVAVNLKDSAPFASLHRAGLAEGAVKTWDSLLHEGSELESSGDCAKALEKYTAAAQIDDRYAEVSFRIGRCRLALGDFASAAKEFEAARDLDALRFRIDSETNDIIRSVTGEAGPGVELLDAAKLLAELSPSGIPGHELFYDHVHLNPHGNYLLARALFSRVVAILPESIRRSDPGTEPLSEEECNRFLALTTYDRGRVLQMVLAELKQPPFASQLGQAKRIHELELEAKAAQEPLVNTAAAYRAAISRTPDDRRLHYNYGRFLDPYEPAAAAYEYRKALAILPSDYAARDKLAAALVRSGRFDEGIVECREVLSRLPYDVPAYLTMAYALARLESFDESIAAYRKAMTLHPELAVDAYNEIGIIETLQEHYAEAAVTFQKAIDLDSKHTKTAELAKNLAFTLKKLGKNSHAEASESSGEH
jgi:tetratricopeptide (TPR) repeat protein